MATKFFATSPGNPYQPLMGKKENLLSEVYTCFSVYNRLHARKITGPEAYRKGWKAF